MSAQYPIPHSHPGRPVERWLRPLSKLTEAGEDFLLFAERNKAWAPMLSLYKQLISSGGEDLFGSQIMGGGMVLSMRQTVAHDEGVIIVEFDPTQNLFSLSYRNRAVEPDQFEQCPAADIWERLRLFVGYKFGIRLGKLPA